MDDRFIIFVGGIHGVGKGTFCKILSECTELIHLSASDVLKWQEMSNNKNKVVTKIDSNQDKLISNLEQVTKPASKYLLDGHFTLLNTSGSPVKIDLKTFTMMKPKAIILLTLQPEKILERLQKRDNVTYRLDTLSQMQEMEVQQALEVSKILNVPLIELESDELDKAKEFVKDIL